MRTDVIVARSTLSTVAHYGVATVLLNLIWEFAQLPLFTFAPSISGRDVIIDVLFCTVGDAIIAQFSLLLAIGLFGLGRWPASRFGPVALSAIFFGLVYTGLSEWVNVNVRHAWAYSEWMPVLPGLGIGLSPLLQWLIVPVMGFAWIHYRARSHAGL